MTMPGEGKGRGVSVREGGEGGSVREGGKGGSGGSCEGWTRTADCEEEHEPMDGRRRPVEQPRERRRVEGDSGIVSRADDLPRVVEDECEVEEEPEERGGVDKESDERAARHDAAGGESDLRHPPRQAWEVGPREGVADGEGAVLQVDETAAFEQAREADAKGRAERGEALDQRPRADVIARHQADHAWPKQHDRRRRRRRIRLLLAGSGAHTRAGAANACAAAPALSRKVLLLAHGRDARVAHLDVDADGLDARDETQGARRAEYPREAADDGDNQEEPGQDRKEEHGRLAPTVEQRGGRHA